MGSQRKKIIVPILVCVGVILCLILYYGFLITQLEGFWKYAFAIIPLALAAVMIQVCAERIREIRKGEEDDIGQY